MRQIVRALVLLLALWPAVAMADARTQARRAFQEGLKLIDAGQYDRAIEAFEAANDAVPHPDVQYNLAYACVDAGRFEEAVKWFSVYLEQKPAPPDAAEIEQVVTRLSTIIAATTPAPATPPRAVDTPVEPGPLERDAVRLRELATAMRAISRERAEELDAIAARVAAARTAATGGTGAKPRDDGTSIPADGATPDARETPAGRPDLAAAGVTRPDGRNVRAVEEYQEQEVITAATRVAAKPEDAPAVVWILTQQQIRERGYETVAEALRTVAGLHVVDDHVFVDVGVRGVHGGLRGQSRIIKVLIDGFPLSFRPTSGNLLGLEMIPIRAIDRIELLRGPASALYGANAFLGVLQIVTRRGGDVRGGSITARAGVSSGVIDVAGGSTAHPSVAGDVILGTQSGRASILLAASAAGLDRSGLQIPGTSPIVDPLTVARTNVSEDDTASPISLFGRFGYDLGEGGALTLEAGFQRLHSRAEWLDYGVLTHFSRVVLESVWVRGRWEKAFGERWSLLANVGYSQGGPGEGHRLRPLRLDAISPDATRYLVESYGSQAFAGGAEVEIKLPLELALRLGADIDVDLEDLRSVETVFSAAAGARQAGDRVPAPGATLGDDTQSNIGAYAQLSGGPLPWLGLVGGLRFDYNDRYGAAVNGRLGAVFRVGGPFYVKALYGSAFRAPAPDQLFAGAAYLGDTIGCLTYAPCASAGLEPQTAHTGELVVGLVIARSLEAQLTGYLSVVDDLILSFPNVGGFFVTSNAGSYLSRGLELEISTELPGLPAGLGVEAQLFGSAEQTSADIPRAQFEPAESIRDEFRSAALFPELSGGLGLDVSYAPAKLGLYAEGRFVGARAPSGSNLAVGASTYDDGLLPAYFQLDLNLSTRDLMLLGERETVISLRVTNALGQRAAEGGFRGWDVPIAPRMLFLRVIQEF